MQAIERILEIEAAFGEKIQGLVPLELDGESLRLILYLKDGTNLRVTEQWSEKTLKRYTFMKTYVRLRQRTKSVKICFGLTNKKHLPHWQVSILYGLIQLVVGLSIPFSRSSGWPLILILFDG